MAEKNDITNQSSGRLLSALRTLIEQGRSQATAAFNSALTDTYWHVGWRANEEIPHGQRAEYGKRVVISLAKTLSVTYGKSFEARNLRRMMQFTDVFSDIEIVSPPVSHLSWTQIVVRERLASQKTLEAGCEND